MDRRRAMVQRFESEGSGVSERRHAFWGVWQYIRPLRRWIKEQRRRAQGKCAHPDAVVARELVLKVHSAQELRFDQQRWHALLRGVLQCFWGSCNAA